MTQDYAVCVRPDDAGEVDRLRDINADLLAALEAVMHTSGLPSPAFAEHSPEEYQKAVAARLDARAAIAKARQS